MLGHHQPFRVFPAEVDEVSGLDAPGTGQPAAGGAAQRASLHGYRQSLRVVHGLDHRTARDGLRRVGLVVTNGWPPAPVRIRGCCSAFRPGM